MVIDVEIYPISITDFALLEQYHPPEYLKINPDYERIMRESFANTSEIELFLSKDEIAETEQYLDILHLANNKVIENGLDRSFVHNFPSSLYVDNTA